MYLENLKHLIICNRGNIKYKSLLQSGSMWRSNKFFIHNCMTSAAYPNLLRTKGYVVVVVVVIV
jgi:hypothetical protein